MASPLVIDPITKSTFVSDLVPDGNNDGAHLIIRADDDPGKGAASLVHSYLEADISSIPGNATILSTSILQVYVIAIAGTPPIGPGQCRMARAIDAVSDPWDEATLTWNNQPYGDIPYVDTIWPADINAWYTIGNEAEMATYLQDALDNWSGIVSMILRQSILTGADGIGFTCHSDDGTNKPKLTVYYTVPSVGRRRFGLSV